MKTCAALSFLLFGLVSATGCGESSEPSEPAKAPRGESLFAERELDIGLTLSCQNCHTSKLAQGGLGFTDLKPDEIRAAFVDVPSKTSPLRKLVEPGDPEASFLIRKLRGDFQGLECPSGCGIKMPIGNYPYAEGDRLDLEQWILDGAD